MDTTNPNAYSVLMSVYDREEPAYLAQSVRSILRQTLPADEIVLMCDGPLTPPLDETIRELTQECGALLRVIRRPAHAGLGPVLAQGLTLCRNEYVARMDTDDVALPQRCREQLRFMQAQHLDLCSAAVQEMSKDMKTAGMVRRLPLTHEELRAYAGRRNPMNHPCVMLRAGAALAAGNYREMPLFEDYDLWIRMLQNGARLGNLPQVLLNMRGGEDLYARRGGWAYCKKTARFWKEMRRTGFIGGGRCAANIALRCGVCLLPNALRGWLYRRKLREQS
ncbi:MAG: glycosyltransferase [Eubacteriales bacterium]|nr:glycosyltransferase [Eubacteriales bacterium]